MSPLAKPLTTIEDYTAGDGTRQRMFSRLPPIPRPKNMPMRPEYPWREAQEAAQATRDAAKGVPPETSLTPLAGAEALLRGYLVLGRGLHETKAKACTTARTALAASLASHKIAPKAWLAFYIAHYSKLNSGGFPAPHIAFSLRALEKLLPDRKSVV